MGSIKPSPTDDEYAINPKVLIGFWVFTILVCLGIWVVLVKFGKKVFIAVF